MKGTYRKGIEKRRMDEGNIGKGIGTLFAYAIFMPKAIKYLWHINSICIFYANLPWYRPCIMQRVCQPPLPRGAWVGQFGAVNLKIFSEKLSSSLPYTNDIHKYSSRTK